MKFLTVRDLRSNSARVWRELPDEKEMVVTSNGRPVAVLTTVNESNVEQSLAAWRRVRATQAIADIQRQSVQKGTDRISMRDIDSEIKKARRARRKRAT
ncbi:MAG: type II toxin-antitoxin system prevent-host-death family antitoxin [Kiritimatiellia bacterium]